MDIIEPIVFAALAIGIIASALGVVFLERITAAALLMAFSFACVAGMFLLLGAETIAMAQVLIYVGAITILIVFGVMLTRQDPRPYSLFFQKQAPWAAILTIALAIPAAFVALSFRDGPRALPKGGDTLPLAAAIFGQYGFAFEVASVLLLAALVGAVVLVKRDDDEPSS